MTKISLSKGDKAHVLLAELKAIKLVATEHFFRTGEILKEVRDDELWQTGWHSFEAY